MFKKPKPRKTTLKKLKENNLESYKVLEACLTKFASSLNVFTNNGLEKSLEVLEELLELGWIKLIYCEDKEIIKLGFWDPEKQIYVSDKEIIENNNLVQFLKELSEKEEL